MDVLDSNIRFASQEDEVKYWRTKAEETQRDLQALREEFLEFHTSSKELEEEMDTTIKHLDKEKKDFTAVNSRLQEEVESLKRKLESLQTARHYEVSKLQTDLCEVTAWKEEHQKYIIRIEQLNDDLERQNRIAALSLTDFEKNLNMALERNVFLENELDGKEILRESIQRLKDEARDLRNELKVKGMKFGPDVPEHSSTPDLPSSSGVECASVTSTPPSSSENSRTPSAMSDNSANPNSAENSSTTSTATTNKGSVISSAARISALSIVGDLLQKVGALETKLASCRNFSAGSEQPCGGLVASGSPVNSPRSVPSHISGCRGSSRLKRGAVHQRTPLNVTM
ncbi:nuclear distribution protein nudE homolog 1 isoform X3 [Octopus sinensis]|uniref:Nuclear distribution protein nudE homolog 1 isoform X3 n=1 Tax=Octopus sinensis TaxID=2607531 RepID=A0A6P7SPI3_9MOLL|nr:nuclear distribution protein nudE homolog 1 isoform X3 [Octopus sinensis]